MELLAFILSAGMLLWTCRAWARRFGRTAGERFWIGVAAAGLQLGTLAVGLSFFRAVTPAAWLVGQAAVLLPVTFVVTRGPKRKPDKGDKILRELFGSKLSTIAFVLIGAVCLLAAIEQIKLPVREFDDRMYHASRAAYWLDHQSVFGWTTHNDRQVSFPFGGELWFFWPLLFTRSEAAAQLVFGLALPLCAVGIHLTLREMGTTRTASALGALAFTFTPIVLYHTRGVRPELWMTLYAVGCVYWAIRATRDDTGSMLPFAMAGLMFALAVNVKVTALPLALGLMVLPWVIGRERGRWRAASAIAAAAVVGILMSAFVVVAAYNVREFGHPLGGREFQASHRADVSGRQLWTHALRMLGALAEPPGTPGESLREVLSTGGDAVLRSLGAGPLAREHDPWPGPYRYVARPFAVYYSLAGVFWLIALAIGLAGLVGDIVRSRPRVRLHPASLVVLFAMPMLLAPALFVRWTDGVPRFWVAAYAVALLLIVPFAEHDSSRHRWAARAMLLVLAMMVVPAAWSHFDSSHRLLTTELSPVGLDEPFFEPLAHIGDGATILLLADQGARDYPLFAPRRGFTNRVLPWGKQPFDADRLQRLIADERVTHVLIQNDAALDFAWAPPLDTSGFVAWLAQHPATFREVPLPYSPGMRLFERAEMDQPRAGQ